MISPNVAKVVRKRPYDLHLGAGAANRPLISVMETSGDNWHVMGDFLGA